MDSLRLDLFQSESTIFLLSRRASSILGALPCPSLRSAKQVRHGGGSSRSSSMPIDLTLFGGLFHGLISRVDVWNEMIGEQQLLGSYRDCRKQRGNVFSWSEVPEQISIDTKQLQSSSFCLGKQRLRHRSTRSAVRLRVYRTSIDSRGDLSCLRL